MLYRKYYEAFNFYFAKSINQILADITISHVILYKDYLFYDDTHDYLKRYYPQEDIAPRLRLLGKFYAEEAKRIEPNMIITSSYSILQKRATRYQKMHHRVHEDNQHHRLFMEQLDSNSSTHQPSHLFNTNFTQFKHLQENDSKQQIAAESKDCSPNFTEKYIFDQYPLVKQNISFETEVFDIYHPSFSGSNHQPEQTGPAFSLMPITHALGDSLAAQGHALEDTHQTASTGQSAAQQPGTSPNCLRAQAGPKLRAEGGGCLEQKRQTSPTARMEHQPGTGAGLYQKILFQQYKQHLVPKSLQSQLASVKSDLALFRKKARCMQFNADSNSSLQQSISMLAKLVAESSHNNNSYYKSARLATSKSTGRRSRQSPGQRAEGQSSSEQNFKDKLLKKLAERSKQSFEQSSVLSDKNYCSRPEHLQSCRSASKLLLSKPEQALRSGTARSPPSGSQTDRVQSRDKSSHRDACTQKSPRVPSKLQSPLRRSPDLRPGLAAKQVPAADGRALKPQQSTKKRNQKWENYILNSSVKSKNMNLVDRYQELLFRQLNHAQEKSYSKKRKLQQQQQQQQQRQLQQQGCATDRSQPQQSNFREILARLYKSNAQNPSQVQQPANCSKVSYSTKMSALSPSITKDTDTSEHKKVIEMIQLGVCSQLAPSSKHHAGPDAGAASPERVLEKCKSHSEFNKKQQPAKQAKPPARQGHFLLSPSRQEASAVTALEARKMNPKELSKIQKQYPKKYLNKYLEKWKQSQGNPPPGKNARSPQAHSPAGLNGLQLSSRLLAQIKSAQSPFLKKLKG